MSIRWAIIIIVTAPLLLHLGPASAQQERPKGLDPCDIDEGYVYCICEGGPAHPRFFEHTYGDDEAMAVHEAMVEAYVAGQFDSAVKAAHRFFGGLECKTFDHEPAVIQNYAVTLHAAGRLDEARAEFERALSLFEGSGDLAPDAHGCRMSGLELLLQNFALFERDLGNEAAAAHYESLAVGCKTIVLHPPLRYSARGCACRLGSEPAGTSLPAWLLTALGYATLRRRRGSQRRRQK